jgi:hypothetical protein
MTMAHGVSQYQVNPARKVAGETVMSSIDVTSREIRSREKLQYRILLTLTYPLFFVVAAAQSILPGAARADAAGGRRSVFRRASVLANSTIPFAFMG